MRHVADVGYEVPEAQDEGSEDGSARCSSRQEARVGEAYELEGRGEASDDDVY